MTKYRELDIGALRRLLRYEPETGNFFWTQNRCRVSEGSRAGRVSLGYVNIKVTQVEIRAHRLAWAFMTGAWPTTDIDHINRDRADNRWTNLRLASNKQNHENLGLQANNTSGTKGVRWDSQRGKWYAFITHYGVMRNLGRFDDKSEATTARKRAEQQLFTHAP